MTVTVTKFDTWTNLHQTETAQRAHMAVREALARHGNATWVANIDDYLQGSYRNSTSIYRDSDIDLVLQYTNLCQYDFSALSGNDQIRAWAQVPRGTYSFQAFRQDVVNILVAEFGAADVDASGNKALKVAAVPGVRLAADVVPSILFRRYHTWTGSIDSGYVEGMLFYTQREGRAVVNFPKQHIANGWAKNGETEAYKKTIRLYKNARNVAVDRGLLATDVAPSYFIECLLYNVPAEQFSDDPELSFLRTLNWLLERLLDGRALGFWCQNGLVPLFGDTPEQWQIDRATMLCAALSRVYEPV
jgi:hypothetical protein